MYVHNIYLIILQIKFYIAKAKQSDLSFLSLKKNSKWNS